MNDLWPELRQDQWAPTQATLHMWTQIVGKIRLAQTALVNHWWNVTLYVTSRGLTTSPMPYRDGRTFEVAFDFVAPALHVNASDGRSTSFALEPMTVADFYANVMRALQALDLEVRINKRPNEVTEAIPFDEDVTHASYDAQAALRFWKVLVQVDRVFKAFRAEFLGKASPVHFFWGSFDLAVTRFSGRSAPQHPGGFPNMPDAATREAYSKEEFSVGFWPGGPGIGALFYAYSYPEPSGFAQAAVSPGDASWNGTLKEFVLPYEAVRSSANPDAAIDAFLQSTYDAAADLAHWDRPALERSR